MNEHQEDKKGFSAVDFMAVSRNSVHFEEEASQKMEEAPSPSNKRSRKEGCCFVPWRARLICWKALEAGQTTQQGPIKVYRLSAAASPCREAGDKSGCCKNQEP
jgi:hypothetical protein